MDPQQVTPTTGEAVNKNLKPSPKPLLKNNSFSTIPIPKISFNLQVNAAVPTSLRTSNVNTPTPTTPPQVESPPPKLHTTARRVSSIKREGSGSLLNTGTSSKSHHHIGFGKRRTRNTLSHMLVDLRGVKKRVNKDLEQFLKTIPEDCSEYLGELYDIASNFIDTTESEICSGAAQQAIKEVKDLEKMITEEPERLTMINLLFIISSCSRFGELLNSHRQFPQEKKPRDKSPTKSPTGDGSPGEDKRTNSRRDRSPNYRSKTLPGKRSSGMLTGMLPSQLPPIPPPPPRQHIGSVYSIEADFASPQQKRKHQRTPSLPGRGKIITTQILCRICERDVSGHLYKSHTELCSVKVQWEVRSLECDNYLKNLHQFYAKAVDPFVIVNPTAAVSPRNQEFKKLSEISLQAASIEGEKCCHILQQLVEEISEIGKRTPGLEKNTTELAGWISYKNLVWQNIIATTLLMRTLIGTPNQTAPVLTIDSITTRIPSLKDFDILKPLTKGGFARVYLAKKKFGDVYAIKVLNKHDINEKTQVENVFAERNILATTSCPFVVRLYYAFQTEENLCFTMEFLNGGDLFSLLHALNAFEEEMAKFYIAECVLALEYLHERKIVHRDLKPDNILITNKGHIKLTDFGLSISGLNKQTQEYLDSDEEAEKPRAVGTPDYLAPEVLLGLGHSFPVDWWALGIILYELLTGIPPFYDDTTPKIFQNIIRGEIEWPEIPEEMSPEAQDLISKLLIEDSSLRLGANGAEEVKKHPFFNNINWDTLLTHSIPPFVPPILQPDDTAFFEERKKYWPLLKADFGDSILQPEEQSPRSTNSADRSDQFSDFWCINVQNLKERNFEVLEELEKNSAQ